MSLTKKRHNIFYSDFEWQTIQDYAKKVGKSASELVRELSLKALYEKDKIDLLTYINNNCENVSEEEEKEIMTKLNEINYESFSDDDFEELSLDEIL